MADLQYRESTQQDFSQGTLTGVTASESGLVLQAAKITEDFEDDVYAFSFTGDWIRTQTTPHSGSCCFTNKDIGNSQTSSAQTTVNLDSAGAISFWYRVSSEDGYDFFNFYIDGARLIHASGLVGWTYAVFNLSPGQHTLKWEYTKDSSNSGNEDSAYIDDLCLHLSPVEYEDFEDGTFAFEFVGDWIRSQTSPHSGSYCFTNKDIGDNQTSSAQTTVNLDSAGAISFWYRVSSEDRYDFFNFYIDGARLIHASGLVGWTQAFSTLSPGQHTLKWEYTKDSSNSRNEDSAYIDDFVVIEDVSFAKNGSHVSPPIDLTSVGMAIGSSISWQADTPTGTGVTIETSLDGGQTWQVCTNGGEIPGLTSGMDLTGKSMLIRETLTSDGSATPTLQSVQVDISASSSTVITPPALQSSFVAIPVQVILNRVTPPVLDTSLLSVAPRVPIASKVNPSSLPMSIGLLPAKLNQTLRQSAAAIQLQPEPACAQPGAVSVHPPIISASIRPLAAVVSSFVVQPPALSLQLQPQPGSPAFAVRPPALALHLQTRSGILSSSIHPPVAVLNLRPVAIATPNIFVRPSTVEARIQINIQSSVRLKYNEELVIGDPLDIYFTKLINTQTSQADFQTGTATNVNITSSGDLQIAKGADTVTEDFEDDQIQFTFSGDWMRSMTSPYSGGYCFKSKTITDGQSTSVETTVTLTQDGNVSFYYRVSSESDYDKFYFFVDGATKINGVSGSVPWTQYSQPLTAGTHTLKWVYTKDGSVSAGEDSAYIDNLIVTGIPSAYKSSGSFTSAVLDISQSNNGPKGTVNWNAIVPQGTDVQVETNISLDGGTTWLGFQPVTNGGQIPGITNQSDLTNARLQYRVTLSTTDGSVSPTFSDITFLFEELARSYAITSESQVNVKTFERITDVMDSESYIHLIMLERPQTDVAVDSMIHLKMFENMLSDFGMEDLIGILVFESFLTEIQSESDGYDHLIVRLIVITYALTVQQDISFLLFANEILDYTMYITDEIPIVLKVGGWNG